ncbi:MAG: hypothetical protein K6G18_06560 [Treponema sp.]|nr:hypothetical protein [Treponema sp.]
MISVKAYYNGTAFIPLENNSFKLNQQAIIVVEEPKEVSGPQKTCRGIASKYANPNLVEKEASVISEAFSGN